MKRNFSQFIFFTALVLLFGQVSTQVFCGDLDCLEGGPSANCATLVCGLLGSHTPTPMDASDSDQDCRCVCHLQFIHTTPDLIGVQLTLAGQILPEMARHSDFSASRIDHPPTA